MSGTDSYKEILRSSSIMGGALGLSYLVGLVRVKLIAVLLGPSGVGLVSLYTSAMGMIGMVSNLGVGGSAVREVAQASGQGGATAVARTVRILRRTCWATGLFGWLLATMLANPVSRWMSDSTEHTVAISVLGVTLLFGAVSGGQTALLQGLRRIGDIARANVVGMLLNTVVAIAFYAWLGEDGIVPALLATSGVTLGVSWWFARRVNVAAVALNWEETLDGAWRMARLGFAFVWAGLLGAGIDMLTRSVITRELGLEAAGIYQAAWALSGLFASFVLNAMSADFYPRLTAVIRDYPLAVRTVNEQTEIGILLSLPGLLVTLAFAPTIIEIFYTERFLAGAELLPWLVLGVFGRVLSWPLGFIQIALGAGRWFAATESAFIALQAGLTLWLVPRFGIVGAAYTFAIIYLFYTLCMLWVARILICFQWTAAVKKLLLLSALFVAVNFSVRIALPGVAGLLAGGVIGLAGCVLSLRGLTTRIGAGSKMIRLVCVIPGGKWLAGL